MQTVAALIPYSLADCLAFVVAAVLPGMPNSVLMTFGVMILASGWKFAIFAAFGYYLLQFLIGGDNAYD